MSDDRYVKLSYAILDHKGFAYYVDNVRNAKRVDNDSTIAVLIAILGSRKGANRVIKVSMQVLEKRTKLSRTQISRHLSRLIEDGSIKVTQKCNGFNDFECNEYTLLYSEEKYAIVPFEIAYNKDLKHSELVAYFRLKQHTDLEKMDFMVYGSKEELAKMLKVSINHVDKIKRNLKNKGIISYERSSNAIELTLEKEIYITNHKAKTASKNKEVDNVVKATVNSKMEAAANERISSISV